MDSIEFNLEPQSDGEFCLWCSVNEIKDINFNVLSARIATLIKMVANVISQVFTAKGGKATLESFNNWVSSLTHILFLAYFAMDAVN